MTSRILSRVARQVARFYRDDRGSALEYLLVMAVFVIPLSFLLLPMTQILADYFQMVAFHVSWPFL